MRIIPGNAQHIGTRTEQQDDFGFSRLNQKRFVAHGGSMATLADGMGGMTMGGEAGRLAKNTMLQAYQAKLPQESIPQALQRALIRANQAVVALAQQAGRPGDIGTTLVAAVINGQNLYWVSVGDSRIYLYRQRCLTQLTVDHDYSRELAEQVGAGNMTLTEAKSYPSRERRALTSYLGQAQLVQVDRNLRPFSLEVGDRILLCSDGLYGSLGETEMAAPLGGDPQEAAEALVAQVLGQNKSRQDNVTVVILACDPDVLRRPRSPARVIVGAVVAGLLCLLQGPSRAPGQQIGPGSKALPQIPPAGSIPGSPPEPAPAGKPPEAK
jgi:protein phosphatase